MGIAYNVAQDLAGFTNLLLREMVRRDEGMRGQGGRGD